MNDKNTPAEAEDSLASWLLYRNRRRKRPRPTYFTMTNTQQQEKKDK